MFDRFYFQIQGLAMGSHVSFSITNRFTAHFEDTLIIHLSNPQVDRISMYLRYIDSFYF